MHNVTKHSGLYQSQCIHDNYNIADISWCFTYLTANIQLNFWNKILWLHNYSIKIVNFISVKLQLQLGHIIKDPVMRRSCSFKRQRSCLFRIGLVKRSSVQCRFVFLSFHLFSVRVFHCLLAWHLSLVSRLFLFCHQYQWCLPHLHLHFPLPNKEEIKKSSLIMARCTCEV